MPSDVDAVREIAAQRDAAEIVVGLPLTLSGKVGPQARRVQTFIRRLSERVEVPVTEFDERYSTVEAERLLRQSGVEPSRDRKRVDAAAAAVILQAYLERRRSAGNHAL